MKTIGAVLIIFSIVCLAFNMTGLLGWFIPLPDDPSPASFAKTAGVWLLLFYGASVASFIGGVAMVLIGGKKSPDHKQPQGKSGFRRVFTVALVAVTAVAGGAFVLLKVITRWDPDEGWAAKVIEESTEVRLLLEEHREENGEFPISLDDIDPDYTKPTDYLTRDSTAPDTDQWCYDRIDKDDYQLFVIAPVWVEYFDAMVYRHKGEFADPWFSSLDASHSRDFEHWRYIRGFSRYYDP